MDLMSDSNDHDKDMNLQYDVLVSYYLNITDSEKKIRGKQSGSGSDE